MGESSHNYRRRRRRRRRSDDPERFIAAVARRSLATSNDDGLVAPSPSSSPWSPTRASPPSSSLEQGPHDATHQSAGSPPVDTGDSHPPTAAATENGNRDTDDDDDEVDPDAEAAADEHLRTAFFRAAVFLKDAYYIWREQTYDQPLIPVLVPAKAEDGDSDESGFGVAKKKKKKMAAGAIKHRKRTGRKGRKGNRKKGDKKAKKAKSKKDKEKKKKKERERGREERKARDARRRKRQRKRMLLIHDPSMEPYNAPWELCEMGLYDFPHGRLVAADEREMAMVREALLTSCMCEDSAVVMAGMIERVLGPLPTMISEISVRTVSNPPLTVQLVDSASSPPGGGPCKPDPPILNHYAHHIVLTLPSGRTEEYAFDLTSAQYGWGSTTTTSSPSSSNNSKQNYTPPPPLVPWHTYTTTRIQALFFAVPLGSLRVLDDAYVVLGLRGANAANTAHSTTTTTTTTTTTKTSTTASPSTPTSTTASPSSPSTPPPLTNPEHRYIAWWALNRHWDDLLITWESQHGRIAHWAAASHPPPPSPNSPRSPSFLVPHEAAAADWRGKRADALGLLESFAGRLKRRVGRVVDVYGGEVGEREAAQVLATARRWAGAWWGGCGTVLEGGWGDVGSGLRAWGWESVMDGLRAWREGVEREAQRDGGG